MFHTCKVIINYAEFTYPGFSAGAAVDTESYYGESNHFRRRLLQNDTQPTVEESKSFWDKIKEFYDDKNNFAMYLVLPIIVIVYGGCSLIYCIAKCRRYIKRKKKPKQMDDIQDDDDDDGPETRHLNGGNNNSNNRQNENGNPTTAGFVSTKRPSSKARSTSDVRVDEIERDESTPLPWQVPDDDEKPDVPSHASLYPTKKLAQEQRNSFDNHGYEDRSPSVSKRRHDNDNYRARDTESARGRDQRERDRPKPVHAQPSAPSYNSFSPPPPYEDNSHHNKEVIPMAAAAPASRREPPREPQRARPPQGSKPGRGQDSTRARNAMESYNMAKQAADLLRLDEQNRLGGAGYKKPKRLVFVTE